MKFHQTNPALKQDAVTEYYYLVPIDKAAHNIIAVICKKSTY